MDMKNRPKAGSRRGQKPKAPSRADLAAVIRETTRLWRKHHLSYDQTKHVVEQVRRRIGLAARNDEQWDLLENALDIPDVIHAQVDVY